MSGFSPLPLYSSHALRTPYLRREGRRVSTLDFVRRLAALGKVVFCTPAGQPCSLPVCAHGVVSKQAFLFPLLRPCWLVSASVIISDGPREWLECLDRDRRICAWIHLLPDSDYLAWDALQSLGRAEPLCSTTDVPTRSCHTRLLRFQLRRIGGLHVFGSEPVIELSPLGRRLSAEVSSARVPGQCNPDTPWG